MKKNKEILILSPCYFPNTGGVETHLVDYINGLLKKNVKFTLLTLAPLTTKNLKYEKVENYKNGSKIIRFEFFASNLYHLSEKYPLINFLYIVPYFLIRTMIYFFFNKNNNYIVHSHGLNCALTGAIIKKIYKFKHIISTHSIYEIKLNFLYQKYIRFILKNCDKILCVSKKSQQQITNFVDKKDQKKIKIYTYWTDLQKFTPELIKKKYDYLFIGRLTKKKGLYIFIDLAIKFPNKKFCIAGNGPEEEEVIKLSHNMNNLTFLGRVNYKDLPKIYNLSKTLIIPSLYVEGFARVALEGLACGLPIIATQNVTALIELDVNESCRILNSNYLSFEKSIINDIKDPNFEKSYKYQSDKSRLYAQKYFSEKNLLNILDHVNLDNRI